MALADDKIAHFTVDNYVAFMLLHPQQDSCTVPDPTKVESFSTSEIHMHKPLISLPNGFSAGLDDT